MNLIEKYLGEGNIPINFDKDGKFIIKKGRKILAKIYDRPVFFKVKKIKSGYSKRYSMELSGFGTKEYDNLDDILKDLKKYDVPINK